MLAGSWKLRWRAYVEVAAIRLAFFAVSGGLVIGASVVWNWLVGDGLIWQIIVTFVAISLLPYLVMAAAVWKVKIAILGTQADAATAGERTEPSPFVE